MKQPTKYYYEEVQQMLTTNYFEVKQENKFPQAYISTVRR